jgi:hypothetical protein
MTAMQITHSRHQRDGVARFTPDRDGITQIACGLNSLHN